MGNIRRGIGLAAALSCPGIGFAADIVADVTITARDGKVRAHYALPAPVRALPLKREYSTDLRQRAWTLRSKEIRLEGSALVSDRPFDAVEVEISAPAHVEKDYPPLFRFQGGGVAVYTALFDAGSGEDLTRYRFEPAPGQGVILFGRREPVATSWVGGEDEHGTYAYFGREDVVRTAAGLAVLERSLPAWVTAEFDATWPRLMAWYRDRFGRDARYTPFVLFSSALDAEGVRSEGHVLPGVLALRLHGRDWNTPGEDTRRRLRWLLAHEAAHFWNGGGADMTSAPWMHEGAANEFADRALRDLNDTTQADIAASRNRALNECLLGLAGRGVNAQVRAGHFDVAYSCGQVMAIYTEAALRDQWRPKSLFELWKRLLSRGRYAQADYLEILEDLADDDAARFLRRMADGDVLDIQDLVQAFEAVDIDLRPLRGEAPEPLSREVATRLFVHLMGADCAGRYSITQTASGLRLDGGPDCASLKDVIEVHELEGHSLLRDAPDAHAAASARCKRGDPIRLAHGAERRTFEWACPPKFPGAPRLLEFGRGD